MKRASLLCKTNQCERYFKLKVEKLIRNQTWSGLDWRSRLEELALLRFDQALDPIYRVFTGNRINRYRNWFVEIFSRDGVENG